MCASLGQYNLFDQSNDSHIIQNQNQQLYYIIHISNYISNKNHLI